MKIQSTSSDKSVDLITNYLKSHHSGALATADAMGSPHVAVIYYSLNDDLTLLFGTKEATQKNDNMSDNKQVAFVVYDEKEQSMVQVIGHVEIIKDDIERNKMIANMYRDSNELSDSKYPPAEKLTAGDYVAIRLIPLVMKMAVYSHSDSRDDDLYETLLFSPE